ncbi:MAG: hypothetical protein V4509_05185 [Patescibacteria group bacterium]
MKTYLKTIKYTQQILLAISVMLMMVLPLMLVFWSDSISYDNTQFLYMVSHVTLLFVMVIRPLADIFTQTKLIRPLVILRKGFGVLSASIIVSFILAKLMVDPVAYVQGLTSLPYWSMRDYALLAHLGDISAVILLITSNNLSKKLLGTMWKKIQKLSYVYFYASALYVCLTYSDGYQLLAMVLVSYVTYLAFVKNKERIIQNNI